jgi:hypothetical protein
MVEIPARRATLGLPRSAAAASAWDNEFEAHQVDVPNWFPPRYPYVYAAFCCVSQ